MKRRGLALNASKAHNSGFTLIELLVVVAVIGILASMVMVALGGARGRARDATRKSDLRQIKTTLEVYYSDQDPNQFIAGTTVADTATVLASLQTGGYIKRLPNDPLYKADDASSPRYYYQADSDTLAKNFAVFAKMENDNDSDVKNLSGQFPSFRTDLPAGVDYWLEND